jgi:hypothetical protein
MCGESGGIMWRVEKKEKNKKNETIQKVPIGDYIIKYSQLFIIIHATIMKKIDSAFFSLPSYDVSLS